MAIKVVKEEIISKPFSMKGWKIGRWLSAHWIDIENAVKNPTVLAVAKPVLKYVLAGVFGTVVADNPVFITLITVAGKSVFDLVDYFMTTQTTE